MTSSMTTGVSLSFTAHQQQTEESTPSNKGFLGGNRVIQIPIGTDLKSVDLAQCLNTADDRTAELVDILGLGGLGKSASTSQTDNPEERAGASLLSSSLQPSRHAMHNPSRLNTPTHTQTINEMRIVATNLSRFESVLPETLAKDDFAGFIEKHCNRAASPLLDELQNSAGVEAKSTAMTKGLFLQKVLSLLDFEKSYLAFSSEETSLVLDYRDCEQAFTEKDTTVLNMGGAVKRWITDAKFKSNEAFAFMLKFSRIVERGRVRLFVTDANEQDRSFLNSCLKLGNEEVQLRAKQLLANLNLKRINLQMTSVHKKKGALGVQFHKEDYFGIPVEVIAKCIPMGAKLLAMGSRDLSEGIDSIGKLGMEPDYNYSFFEKMHQYCINLASSYDTFQAALYEEAYSRLEKLVRSQKKNRVPFYKLYKKLQQSDENLLKPTEFHVVKPKKSQSKAEPSASTSQKKENQLELVTKEAFDVTAVSAVQTTLASAGPSVAISWLSRSPNFSLHMRVLRWFSVAPGSSIPFKEYEGKDYSPKVQERIRVQHAFHRIVDNFTQENHYAHQLPIEHRKMGFHLIAQFDYDDGETDRGVISFATYPEGEQQICYHRYFSHKEDNEFLNRTKSEIFQSIDFPPLGEDPNKAEMVFTPASDFPRVETHPLFGFFKIRDEVNKVAITIFKLSE